MIVQWNQPNMITGYSPSKTGTNVNQKFTLLPGNNEIPDADWNDVKDHPLLKHYIKDGILKEITKPEKDNKKSREGLAQYDLVEASKIVKGTYDKVLLNKWFDLDTRETLRVEINAQLKMIEDKTKKETKSEDDDE